MIKDLLPDMNEFYDIYWFYEDSNPDSEFDLKEECPFPKNGETVCALARVVSPDILFVDSWSCYDQTYSRWYDDWTIVLHHKKKILLLLIFVIVKQLMANSSFHKIIVISVLLMKASVQIVQELLLFLMKVYLQHIEVYLNYLKPNVIKQKYQRVYWISG
jgi:hypothetical protein